MTSSAPGSTRGLRLGRVRGVPVVLTPGWGIVAVVLVVLFAPQISTRLGLGLVPAAAVAAGIPVLLAASVLAHELAHGLTAQRLGMRVQEYVLSLWGGHTAFDAEAPRPGASAAVAVVGPAANAALTLVFGALTLATDGAASLVLAAVTYTNGFVAVFNLLPALPMDGGRLLEALVWRVRGDRDLGTLVAGRCGQALAVLVGLGAVGLPLLRGGSPDLLTLVWAVVIGSVIWQGASASVRVARARRATRDVDLLAWAVPVVVLPLQAPVAAGATHPPGTIVLVAGPDGRPAAWVDPTTAASVPADLRASTPVQAVATGLVPGSLVTEHRGGPALAQVARAARAGARLVVLLGPDGRVLGAVDVAEIGRRLPR